MRFSDFMPISCGFSVLGPPYNRPPLMARCPEKNVADELKIEACQLNDNHMRILSPLIPKFKSVRLAGNQLSSRGLECMRREIQESIDRGQIALKELHLMRCRLDDSSLSMLAKLIPHMRTVNLNGNSFTSKGLKFAHSEIVNSIERQDMALKEIDLMKCKLDDGCLSELSKVIPFLRSINLSCNKFTAAGVKVLRDEILKIVNDGHQIALKVIDFNRCQLDDDCIIAMAEIIPLIREVDIGDNQFTSGGCKALMDAINDCQYEIKVKKVRLSGCKDVKKDILNTMRDACPGIEFLKT